MGLKKEGVLKMRPKGESITKKLLEISVFYFYDSILFLYQNALLSQMKKSIEIYMNITWKFYRQHWYGF